jgi:hypothetical protein
MLRSYLKGHFYNREEIVLTQISILIPLVTQPSKIF